MVKPPIIMSPPANVSVLAVTTSILPANLSRRYAILVNDSVNNIYLAFGAPAVMNQGELLGANGGIYEMVEDINLTTQAINGINGVGASNVTVQEGV